MNIGYLGAAVTAATLAMGGAASAATILIDDFSTDQLVTDTPGIGQTNNSQVASGSAIGGFRDLEVTNDQGDLTATELRVANGALSFSNIAGATGSGTITFDGDDDPTTTNTSGLGGINLVTGPNPFFSFDVLNFDSTLQIDITAFDIFGGVSTFSEILPEKTAFSPILFFSDFTGNVDFTSIGALEFMVTANGPNLDGAIDDITVGAIPLPASALLLLGGLGGMQLLRRRKK